MALKNSNGDDISVRSEQVQSSGRSLFSSRSISAPRSRNNLSSSQSVTSLRSDSNMRSGASNPKRGSFFGGFRARRQTANPDDISVSDSLCSGVLRSEFVAGSSIAESTASRGGGRLSLFGGSTRRPASTSNLGHPRSYSETSAIQPVPGGVADFQLTLQRQPSNETSIQSLASNETGPSMSAMFTDALTDESLRREQRKERVKQKLDRYKLDQKQLKHSCVALEQQLAQTTEKLKEVDSKAAFKIDSLESELRETRGGLERVAKQSTREVSDQGEVIKTLGKKLIRQAHVIKRQKGAVQQYKLQLDALKEEMAMQDERDSKQVEDFYQMKEEFDGVLEQKVQMQNLLQENIEEMLDLKSETEKDAKCIMELEFNLQQKEATLDRVAQEVSEKTSRVATLEEDLDKTSRELEEMGVKMKESQTSAEEAGKELESVNEELEELRCKYTASGTNNGGDGDEGGGNSNRRPAQSKARSASMLVNWKDAEGVGRTPPIRHPSILRRNKTKDSLTDIETFEAELQTKDSSIQSLDATVSEHEATIQSLKSDMVKMSSTYKQDSYLKRKEIAKLKQMNAEYALKLRALEKAFKGVSGNAVMNSSTIHGQFPSAVQRLSMQNKSVHSISSRGSMSSKEDMALAVKARLGLAPYEFPSADQIRQKESLAAGADQKKHPKESQIVVDSNFFGGSDTPPDQLSEDGRKGEFPEEC